MKDEAAGALIKEQFSGIIRKMYLYYFGDKCIKKYKCVVVKGVVKNKKIIISHNHKIKK